MEFLRNLFQPSPPIPAQYRKEINAFITELCTIGKQEDFLSEHPGGAFNGQYRHIRTRAIGKRLYDLGGIHLMEYVRDQVKRRIGKNLATHLDYAWADIGGWVP